MAALLYWVIYASLGFARTEYRRSLSISSGTNTLRARSYPFRLNRQVAKSDRRELLAMQLLAMNPGSTRGREAWRSRPTDVKLGVSANNLHAGKVFSAPSRVGDVEEEKYSHAWRIPSFFDFEYFEDTIYMQNDSYLGEVMHEEMEEDPFRTPLYFKAIRQRLQQDEPGTLTCLDLGTGSSALLALEAARAGAKRVYAIEADPESAAFARNAVKAAGFEDVVEIVEGMSTNLLLPEKVDVVISEICGTVVSEEGLYASIRDAHLRLVKHPTDPRSWIPHRCQTLGAPSAYVLHSQSAWLHETLMDMEVFTSAQNEKKLPAHLLANDPALMLLASPSVLEDVNFTDLQTLLEAGSHNLSGRVTFDIDESSLSAIEANFKDQLIAVGAAAELVDMYAPVAVRQLCGIAMWPRLELDADSKIIVEGRGENGAPRFSNWRTYLPFLKEDEYIPLSGGVTVIGQLRAEFGVDLADGPSYELDVCVKRGSDRGNSIDASSTREEYKETSKKLDSSLQNWWFATALESLQQANRSQQLTSTAMFKEFAALSEAPQDSAANDDWWSST